jgi:hypothetical protein
MVSYQTIKSKPCQQVFNMIWYQTALYARKKHKCWSILFFRVWNSKKKGPKYVLKKQGAKNPAIVIQKEKNHTSFFSFE